MCAEWKATSTSSSGYERRKKMETGTSARLSADFLSRSKADRGELTVADSRFDSNFKTSFSSQWLELTQNPTFFPSRNTLFSDLYFSSLRERHSGLVSRFALLLQSSLHHVLASHNHSKSIRHTRTLNLSDSMSDSFIALSLASLLGRLRQKRRQRETRIINKLMCNEIQTSGN